MHIIWFRVFSVLRVHIHIFTSVYNLCSHKIDNPFAGDDNGQLTKQYKYLI